MSSFYQLEGGSRGQVLIRDVLERLFLQKRWIVMACLVWTAAVALYLLLTPSVYESEIRFLINNNRAEAVISSELNNGPVSRDYVDETTVATELQLLSNRALLRDVVKECGLADKDDDKSVEKTLRKFEKQLKVAPVLKANMIRASYSSPDPREVQSVLEHLANGYLNAHLQAHSATGAYEVFDKQAKEYEQRLKELQDRLTAFHEGKDIVILSEQRDLGLRKEMDLEAALQETEAARAANAKKIATIQSQLASLQTRITTQARVVPNQYSIERLNTMLVEMQNHRTELLAKYQPQDRLVQEVDKQIADTRAALDRANTQASTEQTTDVNPLRQSLEAELSKAEVTDVETGTHAANLRQQIASYRQSLSSLDHASTTDDQLLRDIKETEDNFFLYSKKREEARIEDAMDRQKIANVALVEPPQLPALPLAKLSLTVVATWLFGNILILGVAFGAGLSRASVYTPWELEGLTGLPVLASVPLRGISAPVRALISASILELDHE